MDTKNRDRNLLESCLEARDFLQHLSGESSDGFDEPAYDLSVAELCRAKEMLLSLTGTETIARFGPLYVYLADVVNFDITDACALLQITTTMAYVDGSLWAAWYFVATGGDQAWDILRPALQSYCDGCSLLRDQARQ